MPSEELKNYEMEFEIAMRSHVDRLAKEINELKEEVKDTRKLRDSSDKILRELTTLREKEFAELKSLVLDLKDAVEKR